MLGDQLVLIGGCDSIAAVQSAFRAAIEPHGFTVSAAGAFNPTDAGPEPYFFFQDWPEDWVQTYRKRKLYAADFGVAFARRRIEPFTWNEARTGQVLSKLEVTLWAEVAAHGWEDGFSVPIHGPGGYFGLVTMGGRNLAFSAHQRCELQMLALAAHGRCRTLYPATAPPTGQKPLSAREIECMRWVASGKTDWEIAKITRLAPSTVKTHIENARKKLDAQTRTQAVVRLVMSGEL